MRITITIEATDQEAGLLLEKLREVFGDRVNVSGDAVTISAPEDSQPDVPATPGVSTSPPTLPGRGQIFRNPQLTGEQIVYGAFQVGPPDWGLADHVGVSRPGGETQPVRTELKRPENSFEGYDRYLSPEFGNTAIEMGGAFRVFEWEFHQTDVAVRAGFTYDLEAVFHPLVKTRLDDGREVFMGIDQAGDWMANLEWRWVVRGADGQELAADAWQDGETLGRLDFDLPFDQPHRYRWTWTAPQSAGVTFGLQFRNKWALAMTKVWLHQATCTER
ncbi:MAG: hypothetical protein Kow0077_28790 [Anaerolineae bacterium]